MPEVPTIAPPRAQIPRLTDVETHLTTERLALRPLAEADLEHVFAVAQDATFPRHMSWSGHADRDVTRAFIDRTIADREANTGITWAVRAGDAFVGQLSLESIAWQAGPLRRDRGEIGYWIAPAHQRHGYALEATCAVMQFAFETLGLHKVTIGCIAENLASKKVIERAGFRFVSRVDEDWYRDGRWWSQLRYELTFNEWSDVTTTLRFNRPRRS